MLELLREGIIDCYIVEIIWYSIVKYKKIENFGVYGLTILIQMFLVFWKFQENLFSIICFWRYLSNGFCADFERAQNLKKIDVK